MKTLKHVMCRITGGYSLYRLTPGQDGVYLTCPAGDYEGCARCGKVGKVKHLPAGASYVAK